MSEDYRERHSGERLSSFVTVILLAMPVSALLWGGSMSGPVWAPGWDISVVDITSHANGSTYSDTPQSIKVHLMNSGTMQFTSNVIFNLSVWSSSSPPGLVFSNETDLGVLLSSPGSHYNHTFPAWTPDSAGKYTITASVLNSDDSTINNTLSIQVFIIAGTLYKFRLVNLGVSEQAIERGKSTIDNGNPYLFKIVNKGAMPDSYNVSVSSRWVMKPYITSVKTVTPGNESNPIPLNVKVPIDAPLVDWDTMVVNVTSNNDKNLSQVITFNTTVAQFSGVRVEVYPSVQKGYPGGPWVNFTFLVTNIGDLADSFVLKALPKPVSWTVKLWTSEYTNTLAPGEPTTVYAGIRIPELDYDSMEADNTKRGSLGSLTLQAESTFSNAQGSAEGVVEVGLVHTVQLLIDPMNVTVPWYDTKEIKSVTFNLSVRSVSNDYGVTPPRMVINLSAPKGPSGVEFTPIWSLASNMTESKRWAVGFNARNISLEPGKWSQFTQFRIYYPPFPFCGRADAQIKATPRINATFDGMSIAKRETVSVHVTEMRDFTVGPPEWSLFGKEGPEPDKDGNGFQDWREGSPGTVIALPYNVTNTGNTWDSYYGTGAVIPLEGAVKLPDDWKLRYPNGRAVGPLLPKLYDPRSTMFSEVMWLEVTVPRGAPIGESVNVTLVERSQSNESIQRRASVEVRVKQGYGLDLEPEVTELSAAPGQTVRCTLNLTNTGNGPDIARIQHSSAGIPGWAVDFNMTTLELDPDSGASFDVYITPSELASADQELTITMKATSVKMPSVEDSVLINVTVDYRAGIAIEALSPSEVWRYPGEVAPFQFEILNTGNGNDTFDLSLVNVSEGWSYKISSGSSDGPSSAFIPRGGSAVIWVNVSIPSMDEVFDAAELKRLRIEAMGKVTSSLAVTSRIDPSSSGSAGVSVGVLQFFDAGLGLVTDEMSRKSALPGEDALFSMFMQNRGNGRDLISVGLQGSSRHLGWTYVGTDSSNLEPFGYQFFDVAITPNPGDIPLYDEIVEVTVRGFAGDNISYRTIDLTVDVVMAKLSSEGIDVDLGAIGALDLMVCNMPDPGQVPYIDFPLQRNYTIMCVMDTDGAFSTGWRTVDNSSEIIMTDLYEVRHVPIRIKAPADLLTGSPFARALIGVYGGPGKSIELSAIGRAVFFDCSINLGLTEFTDLYEGGKGHASIRLMAIGNRPQLEIPVMVSLDGEVIGTYIAGPAHPENYSEWGEPLALDVYFDLPTLGWYEKGKEIDIEITIDPDGVIVENTLEGRMTSESNNYLLKTFTIGNYAPEWPIFIALALLFIIASVAGIVGYVVHERRNSYYLLPLAAGLSGILALVFYLPLERGWDLGLANAFGLVIIILDLVVVLPIMVFLFTRAGNAYILHLLKQRSTIGTDIQMETIGSPLVPYLISLAGGLLLAMVPFSIWVIPAYIRDHGAVGVLKAIADDTGVMPVWSMMIIAVLLSVAAQFVLLGLKRKSMSYVIGVSEKLEKLSREVEEGLA